MIKFTSNARHWSNRELRRALKPLGPLGSVINVSGYNDRDKEGGYYSSYFDTKDYAISHYPTDQYKGRASDRSIPIDLMQPLPEALLGQFDLAFNHTVLEHVPNPIYGFEQIAKLSRDLVITIVPFRQQFHCQPAFFGDYFRISPMGLRYLNESNGLETIFESYTPSPCGDVYVLSVGTKRSDLHLNYPKELPAIADLIGHAARMSVYDSLAHVFHRIMTKALLRRET